MGYSEPGYNVVAGRDGVIYLHSKEGFTVTMSVDDMDQWKVPNSNPPSIQSFGNPDTDFILGFTSCTAYPGTNKYASASGTRTRIWSCTALTVASGSYVLKTDTFQAKYTGTTALVNDGTGSVQKVYTRIDG